MINITVEERTLSANSGTIFYRRRRPSRPRGPRPLCCIAASSALVLNRRRIAALNLSFFGPDERTHRRTAGRRCRHLAVDGRTRPGPVADADRGHVCLEPLKATFESFAPRVPTPLE